MLPPTVTLGPLFSCGPFLIREIAYPPGYRQAPHDHPIANLSLVLAGAIRESAGRREEIGSALSLVVKPAGVRHSDEVGPRGALTLQLAFDIAQVESWTGGDPHLQWWHWLHGRPPAGAMLALLRALRRTGTTRSAGLENRIADVLGAVPNEEPVTGEPPLWLRRVKEALDDQLPRSPSVTELARLADAHPVSVCRAFRRHFGMSLTEYRRRERLRRAAIGLEERDQPLSRIAHASGYADHPHLTREFRQATGVTPSGYRRLAMGN